MNNLYPICIIGNNPPPIGGVTVHTKRLLEHLDKEKIEYIFIPLKISNISRVIGKMLFASKKTIFHLHCSNAFLKFIFSAFAKLNRKAIMINTMHGDLLTKHGRNYWLHYLAHKWADYPIMINQGSFDVIKNCNKNTLFFSAFIPPIIRKPLTEDFQKKLDSFKSKYDYVFATNAYNLSYQGDEETYGGSHLVKVFQKLQFNAGLVFSDPTSNYRRFLEGKFCSLPQNILFLNGYHPFYEVMAQTDCLIRYTSSDGDSLSVKEALYLGKPVITTDVVSRPETVVLVKYGDNKSLIEKMGLMAQGKLQAENKSVVNGAKQILDLYKRILLE